jgi:hypothetical protein
MDNKRKQLQTIGDTSGKIQKELLSTKPTPEFAVDKLGSPRMLFSNFFS